ncbi:IS66 family transposase, partial [Pseudomonas aeruginosa]|nr:IS66 family transposase [Pseudomonas aeruginosa]
MTSSPNLDQMTPDQLRALAAQLMSQVDSLGQQVDTMGKKIQRIETVNEQLTHEIALL